MSLEDRSSRAALYARAIEHMALEEFQTQAEGHQLPSLNIYAHYTAVIFEQTIEDVQAAVNQRRDEIYYHHKACVEFRQRCDAARKAKEQ